jgi:hypothetical protein
MTVKPVPDGYQSVTRYLTVRGADRLLDFVKKAFGATETVRMPRDDGTIGHAEVRIGDSIVMIGEATAQSPVMPGTIHLYDGRRSGSGWQPVVDRHPRGGPLRRGDEEAGKGCGRGFPIASATC